MPRSHTEILDMHARLTPQQRAEIDDHLRNQKKIMAIRATREALGVGLKDAKELIDWYVGFYPKTLEGKVAPSHEGKLESALFRIEVLSRDMVSAPEKFDTVAVAELLADICEEAKGGLSSPRTVQGVDPEIEEAIARLEAFMVLAQPQLKSLAGDFSDMSDDLSTTMDDVGEALRRLKDVEGEASEAKEAANDAVKTAEEAGTVAKAAEETADEALELAQNVEKVADDAEDIASGAKALAEEAESEAEAAREEASDAKEIAEDVQRALSELDSRVDELE